MALILGLDPVRCPDSLGRGGLKVRSSIHGRELRSSCRNGEILLTCRRLRPITPASNLIRRAVAVTEDSTLDCAGDLEAMAIPETNSTAVVLGASLAGIAAARTLCPYFDNVVVVERDPPEAYQASKIGRRGVPQSFQPHLLLAGGMQEMDAMFPGFKEDCVREGAVELDYVLSAVFHDYGAYTPKPPEGAQTIPLPSVGATRGLLESVFRQRLLEQANVSMCTGTAAGLLWTDDGSAVLGVKLKSGEEVRGQLVVDASGRGSKTMEWLSERGIQDLPEPEAVRPGIIYRTCLMDRSPEWPADISLMAVFGRPVSSKFGGVLAVENSKLMLIGCGSGSSVPPEDPKGLVEWSSTLPAPDIYNAIKTCTPVSEVRSFHRTDSVNMHFEKVAMPEGLVVLGDAACVFNPTYGQGMTVATQGASLLGRLVASRLAPSSKRVPPGRCRELDGLSQEFQSKLAELVEFPWKIATANDIKALQKAGKAPPVSQSFFDKLLVGYMDLVQTAAQKDWRVYNRVVCVIHMVHTPAALFHPRVMVSALGVLADGWVRGLTAPPAAQEAASPRMNN